ncbi:FAD-dependent monooxygenase, partial [Paenibacillus sepulcri]|nr:FAD-dependent monooxygenase [Paenibacillus sepulcri]
RILGSDLGITDPFWMSRFGSSALQAEVYRKGRIFLAGDAAHIHFPAGGQGMNVGLQEAMNLGWKLAGELKGWAPNWLLDSYHGERFPVNTALLRNTEVQALMLFEFSPRIIELRDMLSKLLQVPEANYLFSSQISAFDVRYEPDGGMPLHPLNGRRFTELKLQLDDGAIRNAYELLRSGSFLFLQLTSDDRMDDVVGLWNYKHVQVVRAALVGMASDWDDVHTALIRPDGYIAWAVSRSEPDPAAEIRKGMIRWCGGRDDS